MVDYIIAPVSDEILENVIKFFGESRSKYDQKMGFSTSSEFSFEKNRKYTRIIISSSGQRSVFCFIENDTGFILKADGWKKPAKHPRGSVHTATFGAEFIGPYGPAYLR